MTSAISSFVPPVAPQAGPAPAAPSAAPKTPNGFAQLLSQRQAMSQEPAPPDAGRAGSKHDAAGTPEGAEQATAKPAAHERTTARTDKPRAPKAEPARSAQASAEQAADAAATADATDAAATEAAADPALADWLAALKLTPPPAPPEPPAGGGQAVLPGGSKPETTAEDGALGLGARATGKDLLPPAAKSDGQAGPRNGTAVQGAAERLPGATTQASAQADAQADSLWQAAVERVAASAESPQRQDAQAIGAVGGGAAVAPAARPAESAAPAVVQLATPATSPEFPKALGVQISMLARDGVQQAELHLNPAEMGPISVQISLDGNQAQVNFGADLAATRDIIENGLPELAAALRDAGFTLSGGGVHGQARGRDEGGDSAGGGGQGPGRDGSPGETQVTPQRVTSRVSAGGVDLYA